MGKNVYVTPKNRDKWHNVQDSHTKAVSGQPKQNSAERLQKLQEKYKQQKRKQTEKQNSDEA